jgi:hypothetical protein
MVSEIRKLLKWAVKKNELGELMCVKQHHKCKRNTEKLLLSAWQKVRSANITRQNAYNLFQLP